MDYGSNCGIKINLAIALDVRKIIFKMKSQFSQSKRTGCFVNQISGKTYLESTTKKWFSNQIKVNWSKIQQKLSGKF